MTRTDIANLALSKLGAEPITDLATDATKEAVHCRIWYDQVLREVLRSHFWSFAMGVTQIGKVFAVEASATLTLGNADDDTEITFTAVTPGIAGNEISVAIGGAGTALGVAVDASAIQITPAVSAIVTGTLTSDGSTPYVFGAMPMTGTLNGRPIYSGEVEAETIYWDEVGSKWWIFNDTTGTGFTSTADVASPDMVPTGAWHATTNPDAWQPLVLLLPAPLPPFPVPTGTPVVSLVYQSSAAAVVAAINADPSASLVVTAALGDTGAGQVVATAATLLSGGTIKAPDWTDAFLLPADFLKLRVVTDTAGNRIDSFDIRRVNGSRCLMAGDFDAVVLEYVALLDEPDDYDPLFVAAFATLLAARMALAVTGSAEYETSLLARYLSEDLPAARVADGQDTRSAENRNLEEFLAGDLLRQRWGNRTPSVVNVTPQAPDLDAAFEQAL